MTTGELSDQPIYTVKHVKMAAANLTEKMKRLTVNWDSIKGKGKPNILVKNILVL